MDAVTVHVGDDLPPLDLRIQNMQTNEPVDLSGVATSVIARFRRRGTTTTLAEVTGTKLFGGTFGHVRLAWEAGQLAVAAGRYEIQVIVKYGANEQTLNFYWWSNGLKLDDSPNIPVRVVERFAAE